MAFVKLANMCYRYANFYGEKSIFLFSWRPLFIFERYHAKGIHRYVLPVAIELLISRE